MVKPDIVAVIKESVESTDRIGCKGLEYFISDWGDVSSSVAEEQLGNWAITSSTNAADSDE